MKRLLLLLLLASPLQATTFYTDKNSGSANDGNACTVEASPCLTITGGVNKMIAAGGGGHTLNVKTGVYAENISTIPSGTSGNVNTIQKFTGATVTIRPTVTSPLAACLFFDNKNYITIDGIEIDGSSVGASDGVNIQSASSTLATVSHHITVQNCNIHHWKNMGVTLARHAHHNTIRLNSIHDIGDGVPAGNQDHGIYIRGSSNTIDGNDFYNNIYGTCLQIYDTGTAGNIPMADNVIGNNKCRDGNSGLAITTSARTLVYNNLIYNMTVSGMSNRYGASADKFFNNVFYNNGGREALYIDSGSGAVVQNNIFYNNPFGSIYYTATGGAFTSNLCPALSLQCTLSNSSSSFTNAAAGDFTLNGTGPAVGNGVNLWTTFTTDFAGVTRQSLPTAWDLGAYKYTTVSPNITLSSPNGGENWTQGTSQTITYTYANVTNVDIALDVGNDGVFETAIATNQPVSASGYAWTVPAVATTTAKIRVKDSAGATNAVSVAVFIISASGGGLFTGLLSDNTIGTYTGTITGTEDLYLEQGQPTSNKNTPFLYANKYAASFHNYALISFDTALAQIPAGANITSATLGVYQSAWEGAGNITLDIRRLLRTPGETTATWNTYNGTNNWTTGGGIGAATDRVAATSAQITGFVDTTNGWRTVTVTDTSAGTLLDDIRKRNNGTYTTPLWWHVERNGTGNDSISRTIDSSEGTNGQRPYLGLNYTTSVSTITVSEPAAGSYLYPGQSIPVRWGSQGISGNVQVLVSRDGGRDYEVISTDAPCQCWPYNGSDFVWTVTDGKSHSSTYFKVVSLNNTAVFGISAPVRIAAKYR